MIKYIKITNYMAGDSIAKQIQNIIDNDEKNIYFFINFSNSYCRSGYGSC